MNRFGILAGLLWVNLLCEAQNWLPDARDLCSSYRLLECTYTGSQLVKCEDNGNDWAVEQWVAEKEFGKVYTFTFTARHDLKNAGVAIAFDEDQWSSDNYVMIPASVYNGNRQRIVNREYATGLDKTDYYRKELALTSNPIPQLSPEFGAKSRLEVLVNNAATPAIAYLKRAQRQGTILLTDQGFEWNGQVLDYGLIVEENRDSVSWNVLRLAEKEKEIFDESDTGSLEKQKKSRLKDRCEDLCVAIEKMSKVDLSQKGNHSETVVLYLSLIHI